MNCPKPLKRWLLAACLMTLSACSTAPLTKPEVWNPDPPPPELVQDCLEPLPLRLGASAQEVTDWALAWVATWGCERNRKHGLSDAWPTLQQRK